MINRPIQAILPNTLPAKSTESNQNRDYQYGLLFLLDIPSESLTHITSYLDPPSLLALARVSNLLYHHVKDDNTWHRAFLWQFLGIGPESDLHNARSIMLRRSERSWRNEFIVRYNLRRRWERSRNATIAHIPLHSSISSMHLMPSHSLLTSSLQYGIVSRSLPLTGKILRGYLDASGTGTGLGIGNPNAEFTPNVSACALTSDGGTAKILWGYRNGEVAIMTGNKVMDAGGRAAAKLVRCKVDEEHEGAVLNAVWDDGKGPMVVTGGADGRVKIWDTKVKCVWTSERKAGSLVPDACVKIASALGMGFVASAMHSGEIVIWTGFDLELLVDAPPAPSVKEIRIPSPIVIPHDPENPTAPHEITALYVDSTASSPTLLVTYEDHPHFYRLCVNVNTNSVTHTTFGDKSFGPISSLKPYFSNQFGEPSFVITGDHLGCVSIYDWTLPSAPIRNFEAHQDGSSVTALAWNGVTLITGSARGMVHVWDALTFEHLRTFASPISRDRGGRAGPENKPVSQILIGSERELLLVSVGDRVMAWKAGPVPKNGKGAGGVRGRNGIGAAGKRKGEKIGAAKYIQKLEMHQTITESCDLLEHESEYVQRAYGREREQRTRLETLGLDEVEAVEYVLMLSRDEALERAGPSVGPGVGVLVEEGVFEGDFDDIPNTATPNNSNANTSPSEASPSSSPPPSSSSSSRRSSVSIHQTGRRIPRISPSLSNRKIQVSPPFRAEPIEAGFGSGSALHGDISSSVVHIPATPIPADPSHFPPISTRTSPSNLGNVNVSPGVMAGSPRSVGNSWVRRPVSGSPESVKSTSAWSTSLVKSISPSPGSSVPRLNVWAGRCGIGAGPSRSPTASGLGCRSENHRPRENRCDEEMDDDLKLAIELSLAEARSRGEDT